MGVKAWAGHNRWVLLPSLLTWTVNQSTQHVSASHSWHCMLLCMSFQEHSTTTSCCPPVQGSSAKFLSLPPQASTAATDQYCTTFDSSTTDSAVSDQENLACHEDLGCPEEPCATDRLPSCAKAQQKSPVQICTFTTPAQPEARETIRSVPRILVGQLHTGRSIHADGPQHPLTLLLCLCLCRNELARERETQSQLYFKRHAHLTKDLRRVAVSWAIQVAEQFRVEQETLFLAVSYLDRFLSVTEVRAGVAKAARRARPQNFRTACSLTVQGPD